MCRCKCKWWMMLEWNAFEDGAGSIMFQFVLLSASGRHSPACAWGEVSCQGQQYS